jgi:hypothetical protein
MVHYISKLINPYLPTKALVQVLMANQNMFFVPPLNCSTPTEVNNIPFNLSGVLVSLMAGLNIVTETGATVNVYQDGIAVPIGSNTGIPIRI